MHRKDVDVVVLNYRTASMAVDSARSAHEDGATSIIVVDNHSGDDSLAVLQRELGAVARIVSLPDNRGFAGGNNYGARVGSRPLVLFMNADAKLHPGALASMAKVFDQDPQIGAVAPALCFPDGRPQASAYHFITPTRVLNSLLGIDRLAKRCGWTSLSSNVDLHRNGAFSGPVESLYGACLLVRRKAFEDVGGFDEAFFLYCEETDFLLRLAQKGWKAYRTADATVAHGHGESANQDPVKTLVIMQESRWIYARKHFRPLGMLVTSIASIVGLGLRFLFSLDNQERRRYRAALGFWLGWTPSADPRKRRALPLADP